MPIIERNPHPDNIYKILLIGDELTGKSNLFERLEENGKWNGNMRPTIGINFIMRTIKISDWPMKLQFWDISADPRMEKIRHVCYRRTYAVFVVYDITNRNSFLHINDWLKEFRGEDELGAQIVLVGNKCDLEDEREVSFEEAKLFAKERDFQFVEVSAKTLENVNFLARLIATDLKSQLVDEEPEPPRKISKLYGNKEKKDDVIKLKEKNEEKKKSVCAT